MTKHNPEKNFLLVGHLPVGDEDRSPHRPSSGHRKHPEATSDLWQTGGRVETTHDPPELAERFSEK